MQPNRFSDFAEETNRLDGDKVKLKDILNKEITVTGYKIKKSNYTKTSGDQYLTLQFETNGEKKIFFTGSGILIEQIEKYTDKIPFITTVIKIDKYYTFS